MLLTTEREVVLNYFELVANEINSNKDDGDIHIVLKPALDNIRQQLKDLSLSRSDLLSLADLVIFFTRTSCLAEVCRDLILLFAAIFVKRCIFAALLTWRLTRVPWTCRTTQHRMLKLQSSQTLKSIG
jgi:hypothetical protein